MTNTLNHAVRAYVRLQTTIMAELDYAARADAGFDGGEWSGPAHDFIAERTLQALMERVAVRFGVTAEQLERALIDATYRETEYLEKAIHCKQ